MDVREDDLATAMQHTHYRTSHERKKLQTLLEWTVSFFQTCHYQEPKDMQVLEIGCGAGNICAPLASLGFLVIGTDVDPESIRYLANKNMFADAQFGVYDVDLAPLAGDQLFDVVVLSEVLEHLSDPARALRHIVSKLRKGGLLLLTTPNGFGPYEIVNRAERIARTIIKPTVRVLRIEDVWKGRPGRPQWNPTRSTFNLDSPHVQAFTVQSLTDLIENAGFRIDEWKCSNFLSFGMLANVTFFSHLDCGFADLLPRGLVSGWYLRCTKE